MSEDYVLRFRMLYIVLVAMAVLLGCVVRAAPGRWQPENPYPPQTVGYDVSWPNCEATPPKGAVWGVVGVTGGLSLRPNKCARQETGWFKLVSLYANTGYPGGKRAWEFSNWPLDCSVYDPPCLAYNYGFAEGRYAVSLAARQGLHATTWWLDVETENSWDDDPLVNRASIQGTMDAVRRETLVARVGIYAFPGQWDIITGKWRPGWPAWAATGSEAAADAREACTKPGFTGGPLWLAQYTQSLDRNIVCTDLLVSELSALLPAD
jgi:hypothetical protein